MSEHGRSLVAGAGGGGGGGGNGGGGSSLLPAPRVAPAPQLGRCSPGGRPAAGSASQALQEGGRARGSRLRRTLQAARPAFTHARIQSTPASCILRAGRASSGREQTAGVRRAPCRPCWRPERLSSAPAFNPARLWAPCVCSAGRPGRTGGTSGLKGRPGPAFAVIAPRDPARLARSSAAAASQQREEEQREQPAAAAMVVAQAFRATTVAPQRCGPALGSLHVVAGAGQSCRRRPGRPPASHICLPCPRLQRDHAPDRPAGGAPPPQQQPPRAAPKLLPGAGGGPEGPVRLVCT